MAARTKLPTRFPTFTTFTSCRTSGRTSGVLLGLLLALALALGGSRSARANGRFPASNAVVLAPDDSTVLVRTTFGVVVSKDHGKSWDFICERAIGFSGIEDPTYLVTPSGAILAATFEGVAVSRDGGCEWAFVGGEGRFVFSDLAMQAKGTIFGIHSVYARSTDAGLRYDNALFVSTDDGRSFAPVGEPLDPTLLLETVEVGEGDPNHVVVSAVRGDGADRTGVLLVSKDGGAHFVATPIPFETGERGVYIGAMDPAGRVYLRTAGDADTKSRLLAFERDRARVVFTSASPLLGFAITPDGSEVYAGSRDGVWSARATELAFAPGAKVEVQCLAANGREVFACSSERSGFFVGRAKGGVARFDDVLHLQTVRGMLACPSSSTVGRACTGEFARLRRELGLTDDPPSPDAGARAPTPRPTPPAGPWRLPASWIAIGAAAVGLAIAARKFLRRR